MLRKLTVDQINDWFTIGKTVTDVELLGSPPAFPAEAAREEAQRRDRAPGACPVEARAEAQAQARARAQAQTQTPAQAHQAASRRMTLLSDPVGCPPH